MTTGPSTPSSSAPAAWTPHWRSYRDYAGLKVRAEEDVAPAEVHKLFNLPAGPPGAPYRWDAATSPPS